MHIMRICTKFLPLFLIGVSLSDQATADDRWMALGALTMANTCLAQDESLARSTLHKIFFEVEVGKIQPEIDKTNSARSETEKLLASLPKDVLEQRYNKAIFAFVDSPWAVCVRKKQWLSKELCSDFLPIFLTRSFDNVQELVEKNHREIEQKKELFDYSNVALGSATPSVSCPP